jgi:hypothetical protein
MLFCEHYELSVVSELSFRKSLLLRGWVESNEIEDIAISEKREEKKDGKLLKLVVLTNVLEKLTLETRK